MKFKSLNIVTLLLVVVGFCGVGQAKARLAGAGASFPFPVYSRWMYKYYKTTGIRINYQSIGSGGGIAQIEAKTVDFGASDAPMKKADLDKNGLVQFPMIMGGVVPVINVPGIAAGKLKLSAKALAMVFLGKITKWNDPKIKALNPGLNLPDRAITVVHRADGSGTTWIFTNYLDKVCPAWHKSVGTAKAVAWPAGIGGKGNEGVASYVKRISGSIGYVEFAYALQNHLNPVLLQNRAGKFVAPTIAGFRSAAANADWANAPGFYLVLTEQPGGNSWPITGASFILVHKQQKDAQKAKAMLAFFNWAYAHGGAIAQKLDYVPMPANVVGLVKNMWKTSIKANGQPVHIK